MTPVPSPLPRQNLEVPQADDHARAKELMQRKGDVLNRNIPGKGDARFRKQHWKDLRVGDFVRIYNDDELPADIIVLSTSDPDGACYVETKNLDGETNLKPRKAVRATSSIMSEEDIERMAFVLDSEPPHQNLYLYNGVLRYEDPATGERKQESVTINELLLRGCSVRNTAWIIGLVLLILILIFY